MPAVRARVGQQLFFVEALGVVKGLLRRVAKQPVCLTLQGGEIIELRGLFLLLLTGDGGTGDGSALAHGRRLLRLRRIGKSLRHRLRAGQGQAYMMIFLLLEQRDLRVPRRQQGQGGRLDAAHVQGTVIEDGEKAGGVDPYQPVSPLAAEG